MAKYIIAGLISYLIGSVSWAYLVCKKFYGIDIRKYGSGNPGTTNVLRVVGKKAAALVYVADFMKGFLVALIAKWIWGDAMGLFCGLFVVIGHDWSLFLNFNGGKGIATSMGVAFALAPKAAVFSTVIGIIAIALTRYVSLGSILGSGTFPLFLLLFKFRAVYVVYGILLAAVAIYKHRSNIERLLAGKEHKLGEKVKR